MRIFSIVVTYNGEKWIEKNLDSLGRSQVKVYSIVADNASEDNTVRIIKEKYPESYLIESKENLGFGQVSNIAIQYALSQGADYILLLNQDVMIDSLMLDTMLTLLHSYPEFGIVSPLHLDYEGTRVDQFFLNYIGENSQLISDAFLGKLQGIYELTFVNAAAWLLSRQLLEEVGGFDPLFFMYGEDSDFCRRTRFHGYKIGVVPTAFAYHWHMVNKREISSVRNQSNWIYSGFIYRLKDPKHSFLRNLIGVIFAFLVTFARRLRVLDFKGCIATIYSILKITARSFILHTHYNQCRTKGSHWL